MLTEDHLPSDKDAIVSAPSGDGSYVLATVNQYPSSTDAGWQGALIEEPTAFRSDVLQATDLHTLLWDAELEQTLDVRNDAVDSDVEYESSRVPEVHIRNRFEFADDSTADLEQDVLVSAETAALLVRSDVSFDQSETNSHTAYTLLNSAIHSSEADADGEEASVTTADGYDCVVAHDADNERYVALAQRRPETDQTGFDGRRVGLVDTDEGPDKSAWADIYEENDGQIDDNDGNEGHVDVGVGLFLDDDASATWVTAVGFGRSEADALEAATTVLDNGYEAERDAFADAWETWHESTAGSPLDDDTVTGMYERSLTSLKCAQDPRGPMIAGAFAPNEQGYRYVWPRDQVILVQAALAAGATEEARAALGWLEEAQITDDVTDDRGIDRKGTWWQNYRTDGEAHWTVLQLDQIGGPIYAHWLLWQETGDDDVVDAHYEMSERAAEFLLAYDNGAGFPGKHQDPWEEVWGYSTEGVAAGIAGLRSMAALADEKGDEEFAEECREHAATWAGNFDDYCFHPDAYLGDHYVTADSPERDDDVSPNERPDAAAFVAYWPWNVAAVDSDELGSTLAAAEDESWTSPGARCLARYPEDDYTPTGDPEDGGWPLCEAYADVARWQRGHDDDAVADYVFEHALAWTTAAGLLPEQVDGEGDVRWNSNLQWSQAMYILLTESHARGEPYGFAPDE
ncbi:Glucoamylase (glucan-1,4-alpha-glucosidase), GH15 family [Halogranum amylolyticum]|uniref:Glucoamylase (Glucan-1,4-alpha-glucosidase), GH15 family n=1 Tax=Halogranum amylolyticum TaxID=660520 RepID=A0A1H8QC10_9EURY|nr:glycoside hydrolase family 15 protein [Halogranum amylolyticum]SEO51464.1 Glucoamylase (glucan-1,4-alpha-glucosidase), GH15 family [Halogranum amylolyticum]